MSSITTPCQKQLRIFAKVTFFKWYLGKILAILPIRIMKKINLEVTCKRNRLGYWNSCKRLPNFVNVAALRSIELPNFFDKNWKLNDISAADNKKIFFLI